MTVRICFVITGLDRIHPANSEGYNLHRLNPCTKINEDLIRRTVHGRANGCHIISIFNAGLWP